MSRLGAIATAVLVLVGSAGGASATEGDAHVAAVSTLVDALGAGDRAAFDAVFAAEVVGMQPAALWQGAHDLVARYGAIESVAFDSTDAQSGGVYVALNLAKAARKVLVHLDDQSRIKELVYSAPE